MNELLSGPASSFSASLSTAPLRVLFHILHIVECPIVQSHYYLPDSVCLCPLLHDEHRVDPLRAGSCIQFKWKSDSSSFCRWVCRTVVRTSGLGTILEASREDGKCQLGKNAIHNSVQRRGIGSDVILLHGTNAEIYFPHFSFSSDDRHLRSQKRRYASEEFQSWRDSGKRDIGDLGREY
jgi:hypothetical protein